MTTQNVTGLSALCQAVVNETLVFSMYKVLIFNINDALLVLYLVISPGYPTPYGVKSLAPVHAQEYGLTEEPLLTTYEAERYCPCTFRC